MSQSKSKRKLAPNEHQDTELFVDAPADGSSDDDTTDSEESVYSGLEEEEEESGSEEEVVEDDDSDDEEEDEDEEAASSESESETENGETSTEPKGSKPTSSSGPRLDVKPPTNEYDQDSSDEEDIRNTVGNIPIEWYREFEHLGYDWDGKKIAKPKVGDRLDDFLNKMENPEYWRTVLDKTTGQNVVLSEQDVDIIERFRKGKFVDATYDPYEPWVDFFTHETMIHPVTNQPAHKRSFIPSHLDRLKVGRMVHAIKMGWMKPSVRKDPEDDTPKYYMIWDQEDQSSILKRHRQHLPAPKMLLPGHEESYNPPPEYLPTKEEIKDWEDKDPEERKLNFIPQKFSCLRQVPGYKKFINERFQRCLDLYLCPRQQKIRMNVDPEDLLPKLPRPQDLQPFPSVQSLVYKGHTSLVRSITLDPTGQWMASGSDDGTVRLWEVSTARCMACIQMGGVVRWIEWNPSPGVCLLAVAVDSTVYIMNPGLGDKLVIQNTDNLISSASAGEEPTGKIEGVNWQEEEDKHRRKQGFRLTLTHPKKIGQLTWHHRSDYLAVVIPEGGTMSVLIHQLSKRRSQNPFRKSKGLVQRVLFHPTRPFLFMATQRYIRIYNLLKQQLTKKLMANCKWVSSLAVHPAGDNLILGSYDCRTSWFDLDLSNKPYHTLRHHKKAIRQVAYHRSYPLFASASDDGTAIVCHGRVFSDLLQNPLIVPVKVLRGHTVTANLGVLDCQFHPTQPWLFTAGADATVRLYS